MKGIRLIDLNDHRNGSIELTPYQRWQVEMYGNILVENGQPEEFENGSSKRDDNERRMQNEEDHWFNEQEF
jgi:hypothetical protein